MNVRACTVSFEDRRGVRHSVEVEAESLYEAAVLGIRRLSEDPWIEKIEPATMLRVEVRAPTVAHALSLEQVERWLAGPPLSPHAKAKLKMMLVQR